MAAPPCVFTFWPQGDPGRPKRAARGRKRERPLDVSLVGQLDALSYTAVRVHDARGRAEGPTVDLLVGLDLLRVCPPGFTLVRASDGEPLAFRRSCGSGSAVPMSTRECST
jgi:hypothetical protein